MGWAYLLYSALCVALLANALWPPRRLRVLVVPAFFAGWLTTELALHHLVLQVALTAAFIAAGALSTWPGQLGGALATVSLLGLGGLARSAHRAGAVVEAALRRDLGPDYDRDFDEATRAQIALPGPRGRFTLPFLLDDPRVRIDRDLEYAPGAGRRRHLDVYRPRIDGPPRPVLLQIHGGGWLFGHKRQQGRPLLNYFAARGFVAVACNYRLSPRARFPDHLVDVKLALRWIRENIHAYGGDPARLAITGGSAGGHLAALAALTAGDPEYQPGFEDADTSVRACVPYYGIYDFTNRHGQIPHRGLDHLLDIAIMPARQKDDPDAFDRASPLSRIHADAPPFCVVHGANDTLAPPDEARCFVAALRAVSKAPVVHIELPVAHHAFDVFHSPRTAHALAGVHRFLLYAL